jgi:hypothetical protein
MPEAEVYFLLNTFANMAIARGPEDSDFILTVTLDLFRVETNIFLKRHYYFCVKIPGRIFKQRYSRNVQ